MAARGHDRGDFPLAPAGGFSNQHYVRVVAGGAAHQGSTITVCPPLQQTLGSFTLFYKGRC